MKTSRKHKTLVYMALLLSTQGCFGTSQNYKPGSTTGEIFVDTPEVFTRERIVGDRVNQSAWLQKQLAKADDEVKFGFQASVAQRNFSKLDLSAGLGVGKGAQVPAIAKSDPTQSAGGTNTDKPGEPKPSEPTTGKLDFENLEKINVTPIENFRDMLAYREEVRTELIETQLDDRHDLEGNTLYRFKFDATIVPEHDTSAWAVIRIRIDKDEDQCMNEENLYCPT